MKRFIKTMVILLFAAILLGAFTHQALASNSLTHYWTFDEMRGNIAHDTAGSVNGTIGSDATWVTGRIGNGAISLNGSANSYVNFGNTVDQFGTNDFTVAFWLNTTYKANYFDLLGDRTEGSHGNFFALRMYGNGQIVAEIDQDVNGTNYIGLMSSSGNNYGDGQWHHVAVTRLANTLTLYIDFAQQASGSAGGTANINDGSKPFMLGRSYTGFQPTQSSFDDIRIYNYALSKNEIANLCSPIVFTSGRDGNLEVYKMNVDGSQINLTNNTAYDNFPMLSPDGTQIAFTSNRGGNRQVWVMNANGTGLPVNLTDETTYTDEEPAWSPDGKNIAFTSNRTGSLQIWVMKADGTMQTQLATQSAGYLPAWSPDGTKIAFVSPYGNGCAIYTMPVSGGKPAYLVGGAFLAWSPDGSKIVFQNKSTGMIQVYVMDADGSNQIQVTSGNYNDSKPVWSADGSKIYFTSDRSGNVQIYSMNPDGSQQNQLTSNGSNWTRGKFVEPTVTTDSSGGITNNSATLSGTLTDLGSAGRVNCFFQWGLLSAGYYTAQTTPTPLSASGSFSTTLGNLLPGTTYHFRSMAMGDGPGYGDDMVFTTKANPTLSNLSSAIITYGAPSTIFNGTISGIVNNETQIPTGSVTITLNGVSQQATIGPQGNFTSTFTTSNLGIAGSPYSLIYTYNGDSSFNGISDNSQTVIVYRVQASVTPNAASKIYGDPDPILTGTLSGFLTSDNVTATYSRAPGETVAGNPYTITATISPNAVLANYNITYNTANFTITVRLITVTADGKSKTYGDADPALTYQVTSGSLVNGDSFSGALSRAAGETVGQYAIQQGSLALSGNYLLTFVSANLTINQKAASVTPAASGKTYGTADPTLTGTLNGFLPADNVTATYSRTAGETVAGSPYTISATLSPAGVLANYTITYNTAKFTITKASATVTLGNLAQAYDSTPKSATVTTAPPNLSYSVTYNGSSTAPTNVGSYTVVAAVTDPNYTGSVTGTLYLYQPTKFVIWGGNTGGVSEGQDYMFWGAQWSNQVTAGNFTANSSFKGYADTVSGSTWTSSAGNSSNPPATIGSYIGVIVSTNIAKSGNQITGNIAETVVLKVDNVAGYAPDPGHSASGTMVAGAK